MKTIRVFDLFLLDMDGTIYLGDELFPETPGFLDAIRRRGARYLFLTNNSSKDKKAYAEKLNRLGIAAGEDDVFSSGDATAENERLRLSITAKRLSSARWNVVKDIVRDEKSRGKSGGHDS